ncbi:MAG: CotH kinase family protein [Verrucomicrobiota bacterium]
MRRFLWLWLGCVTLCRAYSASGAGDAIFTNATVFRIEIEIPPSGISTLRRSGWGGGDESRPTVKATVREGGRAFTNVAVHLKGAAGSFRPIDHNPCFTLNFDKFVPGQSFHGLEKFSLNNSVQDPSYLSERICRELFLKAGVPVPRAAHATVSLNGRKLGLYVLTEGYNKQFLKRHFKNVSGNLYDGGFVKEITESLSINSGDQTDDHSGMRALIAAAREADPKTRLARFEKVLDMERFYSFVAMEVMQCHWDGYAMNRNNYRIFHDKESNKMVFFPHGLDQMFGVERTTPDCEILPHFEGYIARSILSTQQGRKLYKERMTQLLTNVLTVPAIHRRIDELAALIRPVFGPEPHFGSARHWDGEVRYLKQRIQQRAESLRRQLNPPPMPSSGVRGQVPRLMHWQPRVHGGDPRFEERTDNGQSVLLIHSPQTDVLASWRTRVTLTPGFYSFKGKIRTKKVEPAAESDEQSGAGLRISGGSPLPELSGTADWREFTYPFQVGDAGTSVELICELRGAKGEALFDRASLRIEPAE